MRFHPRHNELVKAVTRLGREVSNPFGMVVSEGLRAVGVPVADPEPQEDVREEVAAAVDLYCQMASDEPFRDVLGPVFEEVSSQGGRQMSGQFFTPWDICVMMAGMQLGDWNPEPHPDGKLWSVHEPACGSGAMLLAFCAHLAREHGPATLRIWSLHAVDLDQTLARTCALQLIVGLAATPAAIGQMEVWHGNTLSMEMRSCVVRMRASPLLDALGMLAHMDRAVELASRQAEVPAGPAQLGLFGEEVAA